MNNYFVYHVIHLTHYESSFLWFTSLALLLGVRSLATVCQINVTQQMISTPLDQPSNDPNLKNIYISYHRNFLRYGEFTKMPHLFTYRRKFLRYDKQLIFYVKTGGHFDNLPIPRKVSEVHCDFFLIRIVELLI